MPNTNIEKYIINSKENVQQAMKKLDDSHRKILFVIKDDLLLLGSLTDGDIRRWILSGKGLDEPIKNVCLQIRVQQKCRKVVTIVVTNTKINQYSCF